MDWTKVFGSIATTIQLLCLFAYLSIMAGFLNDYGACLHRSKQLLRILEAPGMLHEKSIIYAYAL